MTITCNTCQGPCRSRFGDASKPVIAIAGLSCETSTFTNARTELSAFRPKRGHGVVEHYRFLLEGTSLGDAAEWRGALTAYALPGGILTQHAFEQLAAEILTRLEDIVKVTHLDGLWYDIHGAMYVEGLEDCESELLRRIRQVIGWNVAVSASLDLHGNVSQSLVEQTDLITCYRTAPHEDVRETKERACHNLLDLLQTRHCCEAGTELHPSWPVKVWIPVPILLPGEQTSTRLEPAKSIYDEVGQIASSEGIIDASVWVGYAWADEPRSRASIVVTGWDEPAVVQGAELLATLFWDSREAFDFVAPTASFDECFSNALTSNERPYFISDSGDNPTAGGSGDVTWTIRRLMSLLEQRKSGSLANSSFVYASLPSPDAVRSALEAGLNASITVTIDAGIDDQMAEPIHLTGFVFAIRHGDAHAEVEVVLNISGLHLFVILTKRRKPYHFKHDFTDLNLNVDNVSKGAVVIVKIGYLEPELYQMANDWMLALTPGGVDQDLARLEHQRIARPMWPLDKDFKRFPDLRARLLGRECVK